ncbi:MAG: type II toxin-antitoxin system PemK/MazF family toxin [Candidatus Entotheonellia bacterium]
MQKSPPTVAKGIPLHVEVDPPEGGVRVKSVITCEDVRSVAQERLSRRLGSVSEPTLVAVDDRLRILLGLRWVGCSPRSGHPPHHQPGIIRAEGAAWGTTIR